MKRPLLILTVHWSSGTIRLYIADEDRRQFEFCEDPKIAREDKRRRTQEERMVKVWYSLYDRMLSRDALLKAFKKVRSAKGAAGVDGQSINDFMSLQSANIDRLLSELQAKSYRPQAVLRVEIPKPSGGIRLLGIPAVRDRVVQQALLDILQPIFDQHFHPSSYGYRPGRSCHQAISKATMFIRRYERKWVVDMDLSKCFDTLAHDIIISQLSRRVKDGGIPGLVKKFLESGVMTGDGWQASEIGSPQGALCKALHKPPYAKKKTMQSNYKKGLKLMHFSPIYFA